MFELIHEFAVLGTACFMLALATVWYSPMLFGKAWMREAKITKEMLEKAQPDNWKHMLVTFVSYVVMLGLLAVMVVYAPILDLSPLCAAAYLSLFVVAGLVSTTLFEGRSFRYFFIQAGFYVLFIVLGTLMLQYWPW